MARINLWLSQLATWVLFSERSSRSSGLIRIGLAFLAWGRFANDLGVFNHTELYEYGISAVFFISTTFMVLGIFSRFSTLVTGLTILVMYFVDLSDAILRGWWAHHIYLLGFATILCALTPCGRSYSVDRWLAIRRAQRRNEPLPEEAGNVWALRLIAIQVSSVYLWSAFDKLNIAFLSGERIQAIVMAKIYGSTFPGFDGFTTLALLIGVSTVIIEITLGIGLLIPRVRPFLVVVGFFFHGTIFILLPVFTFSATMWVLYLAYFNPDEIHKMIDKLQGHLDGPLLEKDIQIAE